MGTVQTAVENDAAVQMDDRSVECPFPAADPLTALLVVFADLSIRDGIEVPIINGDTLSRLLSAEPPDLLETSRLVLCRSGGRCQETEREHEQSMAGALD